jgi:hypothetical protein
MHRIRKSTGWIAAAVGTVVVLLTSVSWADDGFDKRASWTVLTQQQVREQLDKWLTGFELDELTTAKIDAIWSAGAAETDGAAVLERLLTSIAMVDPEVKELVQFCDEDSALPRAFTFLSESDKSDWLVHNSRLYYGRWLAQRRFYDESQQLLEGLAVESVADPASHLFYHGAAYHRLLDKEKCLPMLNRLLEQSDAIPRRYSTLARLMKSDLEPLKQDSLDEIARMMENITRRLGFGRAGTRVRKEEDDVIAKLDKMIEELEQQQQQSGGGTGPGSLQPSSPAQDSTPQGGSGPGNVDQRATGNASGWGNLPPKQRQEALQQISQELPAHFREVIEEYFRKLAREGGN